ncbi:MAG: hypothetical protein O2829_10205 [Bacteroidetes bacterium]|nr:hypothetical protein [Bacteroidota bacterium]
MANDQLLRIALNSDTMEWKVEVDRQGRKVRLSVAKENKNFYPLLLLEAGPSTPLRSNWMH